MHPDMLYTLMVVTQRDLEDVARRQRLATELRYARRAARTQRRQERRQLRRTGPLPERATTPTAA